MRSTWRFCVTAKRKSAAVGTPEPAALWCRGGSAPTPGTRASHTQILFSILGGQNLCRAQGVRHSSRWQPQEQQHCTGHVWNSSGEAQAPTGDLNQENTQRHGWETLILHYLSLIPWERLRAGKSLGWYLLIYLCKRGILDKHKQGAELELQLQTTAALRCPSVINHQQTDSRGGKESCSNKWL